MKKYLLLLSLLAITLTAFAQQQSQSSLYMLNPFQFNPAYAGMDNSIVFNGAYRRQWIGLAAGNPETQQLNAHMPLFFLRGGFGIAVENDLIGAQQNLRGVVAYNYQQKVGRRSILSIGAAAGYAQKTLDGTLLRTPEGNYEGVTIDHQDVLLPLVKESAGTPVFDLGLFFQSDQFEVGLAAKNILAPSVSLSTLDMQLSRTFYAHAAYRAEMGSQIALKPSIIVKSDAIQTQIDFSVLFLWNDNIFVGSSFRGYTANTSDAIVALAGLRVNEKLSFAYGYDFTLSALNAVSNGSHEIVVSYNLNKSIGKGKLPKIIYNPRSL